MISYDSNVLIYALESSGEIGLSAQKIVKRGETDGACLSVLVRQELLSGALLHGNDPGVLATVFDQFGATQFVDVHAGIVQIALELTGEFGRKCLGYDAILLATAIYMECTAFYTNDDKILKIKTPRINILPVKKY